MARKISFQKKHKVGLIILAAVVAVILILALFINSYWSPILAKKVRSVVLTSSDSLYTADFSKAELHVLRGELILYNISFKPDTAVYNRRKKQHLAPNNLVELHVQRLLISHMHPFKLYFKHELDIGEIILSAPQLHVSYQLNQKKDTVVTDNRTPWQKISKSLHSIHIGQIFFNDVQLKYDDHSGNKVAISELKEMNLSASELLIDSTTQADKSRVLFCKEIVAELNNYKGKAPSGLYAYKIKHFKLSTLTSRVNIEGLSLAPIDRGDFFGKTQNDRYTLNVDSLQLDHFDYISYHRYRMIHTACLTIKRGNFTLNNNPNKPNQPGLDQVVSFPTVVLSQLSTEVRIDTILIRHFDIGYSEYNPKSKKTGTLAFNNTKARLLNVTNNKDALAKNHMSKIEVSTYFMGHGKLNIAFNFDLTAKDEAFSYKGSLGPMDLEYINPATMPLAMVKITSGTVKRFDFDIHANSHVAKGKVLLLYNDLKVRLLKADTVFGLKQKLIPSLFANIFIIKHDNPDTAGATPRSFNVDYVRPKSSPFFKTAWATLLAGIKPSAGMSDKKMQATEQQMTQHQINKQNRLQKRAARKQRRAEKKQQKELEKQQKQSN